jgi:N-acyl-D-amino-acid deacylase
MKRLSPLLLLGVAACGLHLRESPPDYASPPYDLALVGGTLVDGTGSPPFRADVGIKGGRIAAVSTASLLQAPAGRIIDVTGLVIAPGFIDLHAHLEPLLEMPGAESHLRQGVTTALGGPDGGGPLPVGQWLDSAQSLGLGINVATLVGHNAVRRQVMGAVDRAPTDDELSQMRALVAAAMGEGAFGLSTGLEYVPGAYARPDEVVALARVAADSFGIYSSHMRDEAGGLMESVRETIDVGRRAHLPVQITHAKVVGKPSWGRSGEIIAAVEAARREGVDVALDVYPYTASSTGLGILVPSWALAGGDSAFARRVSDPATRDSVIAGIMHLIETERGGGDLEFVQFARVPWDRSLEGRRLADLARDRGLQPSARIGAELIIEALSRGGAGAVFHVMSEDDVRALIAYPHSMIASDGRLTSPGDGHPHPRSYGTFPRVLARYVREQRLLTLEEAVRRMSSMPAERIGLRDRGRLLEGLAADVVVFDAENVEDRATFTDPHQYPRGIVHVIVNGVLAVEAGESTGARPGKALKKPRCEPPECARIVARPIGAFRQP